MSHVKRHERRRERASGIHGRAANWPGKHRFQSDDRADCDSRCDAFFFCACGNIQNYEHQNKSENEFENKRLRFRTSREGATEIWMSGKEKAQNSARGQCARTLAQKVGRNLLCWKTLGQPEASRHCRIKMRA